MKPTRTLFLFFWSLFLSVHIAAAEEPLTMTLRTRQISGTAQLLSEKWLPSQTAIIVCDMWDLHPCKNAFLRENEMAPRLNEVLEKARSQGVFIIHAPSACMAPYEQTPARLRAQSAPRAAILPDNIDKWCKQIPSEEAALYPLDQSDGGSDDDPAQHETWAQELVAKGRNPNAAWASQTSALRIDQDKDAISDSGSEIWNLLESRGIRNVILSGVHTNMCVAGRPFGLRQMAKNGKHVVLLRDLTDTMYNPKSWPYVSHTRGTELFIEYVEKRICPTLTSDQFLGGKPFEFSSATAGPKRTRILLLGDSTTEAKFPKLLAPEEPQLEDIIRILLAREPDLPGVDVLNLGLSGEFIRRLLDTNRYDKQAANLKDLDFVIVRYGLNDRSKREDFDSNFPKDFHELIARLRADHPKATIIPMTVIPYAVGDNNSRINDLVRQIAAEERLPLFDIHPRYSAELEKGPNMLNYRRYPLSKIPEALKPFARPYVYPGSDPHVVVLDNRLDSHFGDLPGWYGDRHPNLAGYHVIADETAKFLAPLIREKQFAK
jgi:lysophospholipase L1-like esterase/nicotinamidase-related amidase